MLQGSPLLNNEISGLDLNDEKNNMNYQNELGLLYNEIYDDLLKADQTNMGKVSEDELLEFLQKKLPPGKPLNVPLFKKLFQDLDRGIDMNIDLNDFCKKYIQAHEEMKLNYDTLKKGFDKETSLRSELEKKIQESKQETLNQNGISLNSCVSTEIGKITFNSALNCDEVFCEVSMDGRDGKRTASKPVNNPLFFEKFTFPIKDKQTSLCYKVFCKGGETEPLCETEVPLYIINVENDEITPDFELKDYTSQTVGFFSPKLIIVTSYYEMYQKQYDNIEKNIESYQSQINQLNNELEDLSLPYKKEFELNQIRVAKGIHDLINNDNLVNGVEGIIKHAFPDKKVKWITALKVILFISLVFILLTSIEKPDFISLFIEITLLIIIGTDKTNYLFDYFNIWLIGILVIVFYDIFDYLFLRNGTVEALSSIKGWTKFFGLLGFIAKVALLSAVFIVKTKYDKTGKISE